jgi:uncharacterized protein (TIGR04222 family)
MPWNPFDWTAGPFLTLYVTVAAIIFLAIFHFRSVIGPAARATHPLSELELAYLAGGALRLGDAVLLTLTSGNGATIDPKVHKITVTDQRPLAALMSQAPLLPVQPNMTRRQFQTAVTPIVERVQQRLQEFGYYPTDEQMTSFRTTVLPFVALLVVFGIIKAFVGAERHHPIGFLVILLFVTAFAAGIALATYPTRTRAGKEVLEAYQASHARASRAPLDQELLLAVALSGAVVLSGTPYASVYAASRRMSSGGDGGGGCGGGGGGGCGGCS